MGKHRVRTHHWYDGILKYVDAEFETIEQALEFAKGSEATNVKVYGETGEIVHEIHTPFPTNTYA
jgi:hypothetical protein